MAQYVDIHLSTIWVLIILKLQHVVTFLMFPNLLKPILFLQYAILYKMYCSLF